ncbi:MAG: hypothetical protein K2V38_12610, partial [Gemmataceae bacterium]|nr:hypothetical protein [Gemmataceae bacterium]
MAVSVGVVPARVVDIAAGAGGELYGLTSGVFGGGGVVRIDPVSLSVTTVVPSTSDFSFASALGVGSGGLFAVVGGGLLVRINTSSGQFTAVNIPFAPVVFDGDLVTGTDGGLLMTNLVGLYRINPTPPASATALPVFHNASLTGLAQVGGGLVGVNNFGQVFAINGTTGAASFLANTVTGIIGATEDIFSLPAPDIAVSSAALGAGGELTFSYTVTGTLRAAAQIAVYWSSSPSFADRIGAAVSVVNTATSPGTYGPVTIASPALGTRPAGATHLLVVADPDGSVTESNEANNIVAVQAPLPDIVMLASSLTSDGIRFQYNTVGDPGKFTVSVYHSSDYNLDPADVLLAEQTVTPFPNASGAGTISIASFLAMSPMTTWPYLLVVADAPGRAPIVPGPVNEANESNNQSSLRLGVTLDQLSRIMPRLPLGDARRFLLPLNSAMEEFEINTPKRVAAFLSQIAYESTELTAWSEAANRYSGPNFEKYDFRSDLGNSAAGDGLKFRGSGPLHLTGKYNFLFAG